MCRIFGSLGDSIPSQEVLVEVAKTQSHGGPDSQCHSIGNSWTLGNNRLAIEGLAGGRQPFYRPGIAIVYNGEIFNHQELRYKLAKEGYVVEDPCDGAVLPALYERYGIQFVEHLDGMFSMAIIDERQKPTLFLITDPAAVKSVYYAYDSASRTLCFSSELPPLFSFPTVPQNVSRLSIHEYLSLRSVWAPRTCFEGVRTIPPQSILEFSPGSPERVRRYAWSCMRRESSESQLEGGVTLRRLLEKEVSKMFPLEVPACLVTSGGLDSSLLTVLASTDRVVDTYHLCYRGVWPDDERGFAREVAQRAGARYNEVEVDPARFPEILEKVCQHLGQPNSAPHNISTYELFRSIAKDGFKVALTGEGADEFFAGYQRFVDAVHAKDDSWSDAYLTRLAPFAWSIRDRIYTDDFRSSVNDTPGRVETVQTEIQDTKPGFDRLQSLLSIDQNERMPAYILRRVDHLSMAHAVEVRVPFCQPAVMAFARSLPIEQLVNAEGGKRAVYAAAEGLLPRGVLKRKKQPFTLPIQEFLKPGQKLFECASDIISSKRLRERGMLNQKQLSEMLSRPMLKDEAMAVWSAVVLEMWFSKNIRSG